jgi:hypothetical protein
MSNNYVQVPPNSTGVKLQTFENTVGGNTVDAEAVAIVDTAGASILGTAGSPNADVITVQGVSGGTAVPVSGTVAATESGAWNVNQTLGTPGFEAITDGTNGPAAVKAASTAAVATDKALVVAISPNNTIPVSGTVTVTPSGTQTVAGNKTNNNAAPGATNVGTLPAIANAAVQTWTEGDQVALSEDLNGSLRTSSGSVPEATAAWTSATAANTALTVNLLGYNTVVVTAMTGSTLTGGTLTFEVSDTTAFTNAYAINAVQVNGTTVATAFGLGASSNVGWVVNVAGWTAFRIRLSSAIVGTTTLNLGIQATAGATTPLPVVQGTVTGNVRSIVAAGALADNQLNTNFFGSATSVSEPLLVADSVYGGAFSGAANAALQGWSKRRTPTVFKTVQATASGNTAVWTPGSGNKFRLLKVFVELTDNASIASGAVVTISFQDSSTAMPIAFDVFIPTTAVTTVIGDGLEQELDLGAFGILSAAANNVLNVNLSTVLATGNVRVIAMGTEE